MVELNTSVAAINIGEMLIHSPVSNYTSRHNIGEHCILVPTGYFLPACYIFLIDLGGRRSLDTAVIRPRGRRRIEGGGGSTPLPRNS